MKYRCLKRVSVEDFSLNDSELLYYSENFKENLREMKSIDKPVRLGERKCQKLSKERFSK